MDNLSKIINTKHGDDVREVKVRAFLANQKLRQRMVKDPDSTVLDWE